jgi:hypothetical protein
MPVQWQRTAWVLNRRKGCSMVRCGETYIKKNQNKKPLLLLYYIYTGAQIQVYKSSLSVRCQSNR